MKKNLIANPFTAKTFSKPEATDFYDQEITKVGSNYPCPAVLLFNFILIKEQNYYPQVFLKEFEYIEKTKRNYKDY